MRRSYLFALPIGLLLLAPRTDARDFLLTIGGGYAPEANQASLENNVLFYLRTLREQDLARLPHAVYFADGSAPAEDLQVRDAASLPKANRLMAEFFGSERDLGLRYRNHAVPGVRGAADPDNIRRWFSEVGPTMRRGDRLILYVTAHGDASDDRDNDHNTSISLWNHRRLTVTELVELLDRLPGGVSVVAVMVQCYTGGFARFIYNNADPDKGLSPQQRCGFFATVYDRAAAGCTSDVEEESYVEYSTYFWEALGGRTRTGESIVRPDYDGNGRTTLDEAHAYTVIKAETIDLPVKSSSEFLSVESVFADEEHPGLLPEDAPYDQVYAAATPAERAILDGLSAQLALSGSTRIETARRESQAPRRGPRRRDRGRSTRQSADRLRRSIAEDLEQRWPELANVLNPGSVELLTSRSQSFVTAVEQHPSYRPYRELQEQASRRPDPEKRRTMYERFIGTAEDIILRENLKRLGDAKLLAQYEAIVAAESTTLGAPETPPVAGAAAR